MRRCPLVAASLGLLCTLAGCARPVPLYPGPERPVDELAILEAPGHATILQVDGRQVDRLDKRFALEPGPHLVLFRVRRTYHDFGGRGSIEMGTLEPQFVAHCFATVEMQAGHTYAVSAQIRDLGHGSYIGVKVVHDEISVVATLEDTTTGEPVPGLRCDNET